MTRATPAIQVGSLAIATRASGVSDMGERGVCYEVYTLGGRPGYSLLFEQGRYDGFSPEDVTLFLTITGEVCAAVADYGPAGAYPRWSTLEQWDIALRRDLVEDLTQDGLLACWTRCHAPHIQHFPRYYAAMLRGLVT
jgi:hypothetical protein